MLLKRILFIIVFSLPLQANADSFSTDPLCYKSSKPLMLSPNYLIRRYEKDVKNYKLCIENYIAEQKRAIQLHKDSIHHAEQLLKDE